MTSSIPLWSLPPASNQQQQQLASIFSSSSSTNKKQQQKASSTTLPTSISLCLPKGNNNNEDEENEFWWLPTATRELISFFSNGAFQENKKSGAQQNQLGHQSQQQQQNRRVTLLVCDDNNVALYLAQVFASVSASSNPTSSFISSLLLSVAKRSAARSSSSEQTTHNTNINNKTSLYLHLLRLVAAAKSQPITNFASRVIVTTQTSLSSHAAAEGKDLSFFSQDCDVVCLPGVEKEFCDSIQSMTSRILCLQVSDSENDSKNNSSSSSSSSASTPKITCSSSDVAISGKLFSPHPELSPSPFEEIQRLENEELKRQEREEALILKQEQEENENDDDENEDAAVVTKSKQASAAAAQQQQQQQNQQNQHDEDDEDEDDEEEDEDDDEDDDVRNLVAKRAGCLSRCFDDEAIIHLVCCGDLSAFIRRVRQLHDEQKQNVENIIWSALLGGTWLSTNANLIHLKIAHVFRSLLDRKNEMNIETGYVADESSATATLRYQVSRAVQHLVLNSLAPLNLNSSEIVAMVPRSPLQQQQGNNNNNNNNSAAISSSSSSDNNNTNNNNRPAVWSTSPFLLRVIASYAVGVAPHGAIDALCSSWGIRKDLVSGTRSTKQAARKRGAIIHAIRMKYCTRLGDAEVGFLEFALHCVLDQACRLAAVSVGEIRNWLMWNAFFQPLYGDLSEFLTICQLVGVAAASATNNAAPQKQHKVVVTDRTLLIIPDKFRTAVLSVKDLPLAGSKDRHIDTLHVTACEEILSAMPSRAIPMYIGDVGNLIGAWTTFNARYEGQLAGTLTDFLLTHPDKFRVVSNVVMRVTESKTQQVRVRFNDREHEDEDDEDQRMPFPGATIGRGGKILSKRHRAEDEEIAQTGGRRKFTQRSRKKALRAARNRKRFDRNHKSIAQDAKVPGYVKPKQKKIKGRGKKTNAKSWKRQI